MKKQIVLIALAISAFAACKKEDILPGSNPTAGSAEAVNSNDREIVPVKFTQKLLMEMYSTAGCATCPDAETKYRNYAAQNPNKVYGVCIHNSDAMASPQFPFLNSLLNITAYSSGSFNRLPFSGAAVVHKTQWTNTNVTTALNKTAKCGLKINSSVTGTTATINVYAGFNQAMSGNYKLTVYLMEDSVSGTGSGYNQSNYYNNSPSSPFYQLGNPIVGYQHPFVLRKVLTPSIGTPIASSYIKAGGQFQQNFTVSIAGYDKPQLYVVAFVNKQGSSSTTQEIMNVQRVKLGQNKNYD